MARTVVVGVEGTESSRDALVWAAEAAKARHATLVLLHAVGTSALELAHDDGVEHGAATLLKLEADRARAEVPGVEVVTELAHESAGRALTARSARADLLVVGTRRLSGAQRIFSGSFAYQVAAGAECPVAVVPQRVPDAANRVVVGVDGSAASLGAVRAAAREADRTGAELVVVHAWEIPAVYVSITYLPPEYDAELKDAAQVLLGESVAGLAEEYPDLVVRQRLVQDQPATALLDAAEGARLLVVGTHGRHGVARMLLGSVSHAVVLHAQCPVLVARR